MKLSVIIVNYNVKYFIEQCLYSVLKAMKNIEGEIIVVDNNSIDGSQLMLKEKFPQVKLICNTDNIGFSKANNLAIREAKGEYILCLNPDTIIEEATLDQCVAFMDTHPDAGGVGPKMIDGKGQYLKESKRGLPTPKVAFFKIVGLTRLFPKSKLFAQYYLGHLDVNQVNKIEILTGSFMFMRKSVLDKVGLFDESFFMYGEDIDLSYRILKAGYSNYYLPETTIIHYRGESTKKGTINYVMIFYKAMNIFARKHISSNQGKLFSLLIDFAIHIRAFLSILKRFFIIAIPLLMDCFAFYLGINLIKNFWLYFYLQVQDRYPNQYNQWVIPGYIAIWILCLYIFKAYKFPVKFKNVFKGVVAGLLLNLIGYALMPEKLHFSRAILLISSIPVFSLAMLNRIILNFTRVKKYSLFYRKNKRFVIVGYISEAQRVSQILIKSGILPEHIEFVSPDSNFSSDYNGNIFQLSEIIKIQSIGEVIFCSKDLSAEVIIDNMKKLNKLNIDFKIASPEGEAVVGSNSKNNSGEIYAIKIGQSNQ
jgi:O-antigen biosynthesis protein